MQELKDKLGQFLSEITNLGLLLKINQKSKRIEELQLEISHHDFWNNPKKASEVIEELKDIKDDVESYNNLKLRIDESLELTQLDDQLYAQELKGEVSKIQKDLETLKLKVYFSEKFDGANAIVEINAGAGGTESCDWASMLFRMYSRWAQDKGFKFKLINELRGDEAGIKNVTFFIEGKRAYGLLKSENGVHRLVRISPFDANKRRHTSFASIEVMPEVTDDQEIEVKPEELKIETCRSSGAGGQHVNVTDSAVRIIHLATGIVVGCQNERSQHQNKEVAMRLLKAKLYELKEKKRQEELAKLSGNKQKIEWGSQIRSYVLHPYLLVKDHRTDCQTSDAWGVLDGKLDEFIYAYLKYLKG